MESVNAVIELWPHPQTGVVLPFVDARLVAGQFQSPTHVITYLRGEVGSRPCFVQVAYERWSEPTDWVVPPVVDGEMLPDMELSLPMGEDGRAPSVSQQPITAVLGLSLILLGLVWFLHRVFAMLAGGR